jgi:hypothetical protein
MPDTGAPWNIPYADPTDLVRDWPALSEDIAEAVAAGLDIGIGTNVVNHRQSTRVQTTSTSYTAITGFTVSITPSSTSSKVLVVYTIPMGVSISAQAEVRLLRGVTALDEWSFNIGDAANRPSLNTIAGHYLDSPNSATAVTYSFEFKTATGTLSAAGNNINWLPAFITAIEVAA